MPTGVPIWYCKFNNAEVTRPVCSDKACLFNVARSKYSEKNKIINSMLHVIENKSSGIKKKHILL